MSRIYETGGSPATLADYYLREQIRNEALGEPYGRRIELLQGLIHQVPNRVYFNEEGEMMRAVLFRGQYLHEAFLDVIQPFGGGWEQIKTEYLIGKEAKDLEAQIAYQRRRYGMRLDLLTEPTVTLSVDSELNTRKYIHLGEIGSNTFVSCEYYLTQLFDNTPRFIGFGYREHTPYPESHRGQLARPPEEIVLYSRGSGDRKV